MQTKDAVLFDTFPSHNPPLNQANKPSSGASVWKAEREAARENVDLQMEDGGSVRRPPCTGKIYWNGGCQTDH